MNYHIKDGLILTAFVYLTFSGVGFFIGILHSGMDHCQGSIKRIEVMFPAYRIGCWAGQPLNGDSDE